MIRVAIVNLIVFLLPFFAWWAFERSRGRAKSFDVFWSEAPLVRLFLSGAVLVLLVLATFASFTGSSTSGRYVPPSVHDGKLEPGKIE